MQDRAYKAGDVIINRYRGGPGTREILLTTSAIAGQRTGIRVTLIIDGPFATRGFCVGHVQPEAAVGDRGGMATAS